MCAIDALGVAPMFAEKVEVTSRDPLSGDAIEARVAPDGTADWSPRSAVVVAGALDRASDSCRGCCPVLNFFVSPANAESWLTEHPQVRGTVISMDEAAATGRAVFGDVPTQKEEIMNHEQAQANIQLVLDRIDAMRRSDVDSIAEKFHPDVVWVDVADSLACEGREQVLAWLRSAPAQLARSTRSSCSPTTTMPSSAFATTPLTNSRADR